MRKLLPGLVLILFPALVCADEKAGKVLEAALTAHGGETALAKTQQYTRTASGITSSFGRDVPFTDELTMKPPEKMRLTIDAGSGAQKVKLVQVVNGDKGWAMSGGTANEMSKERLDEMREEMYFLWLSTLVPLVRDKSLTSTFVGEGKVNNKPADVVTVASKGHPDVKLYFDKDSHLLVKAERQVKEAGVPFLQEMLFGDYKEFDGAKLPTKVTEMRSGKRFTELGNISYKFPRTIDEGTFGKP